MGALDPRLANSRTSRKDTPRKKEPHSRIAVKQRSGTRSVVVSPLRKDSRVSNYPRRTCGMRLPGVVALLSGCAAAGTETGHHSWDHTGEFS